MQNGGIQLCHQIQIQQAVLFRVYDYVDGIQCLTFSIWLPPILSDCCIKGFHSSQELINLIH